MRENKRLVELGDVLVWNTRGRILTRHRRASGMVYPCMKLFVQLLVSGIVDCITIVSGEINTR